MRQLVILVVGKKNGVQLSKLSFPLVVSASLNNSLTSAAVFQTDHFHPWPHQREEKCNVALCRRISSFALPDLRCNSSMFI